MFHHMVHRKNRDLESENRELKQVLSLALSTLKVRTEEQPENLEARDQYKAVLSRAGRYL